MLILDERRQVSELTFLCCLPMLFSRCHTDLPSSDGSPSAELLSSLPFSLREPCCSALASKPSADMADVSMNLPSSAALAMSPSSPLLLTWTRGAAAHTQTCKMAP